jgi:hypothetical protein
VTRRRASVKRIILRLSVSTVALVAIGAIFAALTGRGVWHSITWALILGGALLVVLNVAGSGSGTSTADPRTGTSFGGVAPDATMPPGWLIVGLALVGLGVLGLFA